MSLSVCKMNNNEYETLFEFINTLEEAELLAQLSMCNKEDDELIFIFPGFNMGINEKHKDKYKKALLLAEKYKAE